MVGLGAILSIGEKVLDRVIPDPEQRERAKQEMYKLQAEGDLKKIELQLSAIIAEAQSKDKWTSRARPTFLYVMYLMILSAIPMGFLFAFAPATADAVTQGVGNWLNALPDELWYLFGTGYLGYTGARTFDKYKTLKEANKEKF